MKQKSTFFTKLMTLVLAAILCMVIAVPAFANEEIEEISAQAKITKVLTMPEGTVTPEASFTFNFAAKNKDGKDDAATLAAMPVIADKEISFTKNDDGNAKTDESGIKSVQKETNADILEGIDWPSAGIYVYEVTEQDGNQEGDNDDNGTITYSQAKYNLKVYVENKKDQADGSDTYVKYVFAEKIANDNGVESTGEKKVDPAPGKFGLSFTNSYIKQGDGDLKNAPASISKTVAGNYADRSKYFSFKVTLNQPAAVTGAEYEAYVVDATGKNVTSIDNYPTIAQGINGAYIAITSGKEETIKLKHGQKLVFPDIHIGATYEVEETAAEGYTPSVVITENGTVKPSGTPNPNLSTGTLLIGDSGPNTVDYTNTRQNVTPGGVMINNLPFIMIFILAAGAFVVFVVVKSRKRSH